MLDCFLEKCFSTVSIIQPCLYHTDYTHVSKNIALLWFFYASFYIGHNDFATQVTPTWPRMLINSVRVYIWNLCNQLYMSPACHVCSLLWDLLRLRTCVKMWKTPNPMRLLARFIAFLHLHVCQLFTPLGDPEQCYQACLGCSLQGWSKKANHKPGYDGHSIASIVPFHQEFLQYKYLKSMPSHGGKEYPTEEC